MTTLDRNQLDTLAGLLRARGEALRAFIAAGRHSPDANYADVSGAVHSLSDESFAELTAALSRMNLAKASEELREVEAAMDRIRDGSYGICVDCGAGISYARLRVAPETRRCALCQTKNEDRRGGRDSTPSL